MLKGINIGHLDTRLTLQRSTKTNNAITNEETEEWNDLKRIWVKELPVLSREQYEAKQQVAKDEIRFLARRSAAIGVLTVDNTFVTADNTRITADYSGEVKLIDETMRVVRRGEVLYINGIENRGREGFVIIRAEKRDNG
jgi:hypothetical protein